MNHYLPTKGSFIYTLVNHLGLVRPVYELYHYNEDQSGDKIPHQFISGKTVKGRLISESFSIWPNHYPEHHMKYFGTLFGRFEPK